MAYFQEISAFSAAVDYFVQRVCFTAILIDTAEPGPVITHRETKYPFGF
jgi:hypothetical protein